MYRLIIFAFLLLGIIRCNERISKTPLNHNDLNVLIYSKTEAYRHSNIETAVLKLKEFAGTKGFDMSISESDSIIHPDSLARYNVIVFLNTTGNIFNTEQQAYFRQWYRNGKGFVGIHSATDTEYDWPWYHQLVGGYFEDHPPGTSEARIQVIDGNHHSTSMLPRPWIMNEEWYNLRDLVPETNKLLNLDESSYEGGRMGADHPLAWYREFDGGRSWYTAMGHKAETFSDSIFLEHICGGIAYAGAQ